MKLKLGSSEDMLKMHCSLKADVIIGTDHRKPTTAIDRCASRVARGEIHSGASIIVEITDETMFINLPAIKMCDVTLQEWKPICNARSYILLYLSQLSEMVYSL